MGKTEISGADFIQLAKLALQSTRDDVALFVRRIARRLQGGDTRLAAELEKIVQGPARGSVLRDAVEFPPVDADSRLQLLRTETPTNLSLPVWSDAISESLQQVITEREHRDELEAVEDRGRGHGSHHDAPGLLLERARRVGQVGGEQPVEALGL